MSQNKLKPSKLTNRRNHCAYKVESSRKVPAGPQCVHPDPGSVCLLVLTQQSVKGAQVDPVSLGEVIQLLFPKVTGAQLEGMLQGWEDGGPAQQVEQDEPSQQAEAGIVFVHGCPGATAATSSSPLSHESGSSTDAPQQQHAPPPPAPLSHTLTVCATCINLAHNTFTG